MLRNYLRTEGSSILCFFIEDKKNNHHQVHMFFYKVCYLLLYTNACFSERQESSLHQPQCRAGHSLTLIQVVVYFLESHSSLGWFLLHLGRVVSHSITPLL